ncbi:MAG: hypothetical protein JWN89_772 [Parcubacteria group bacterium]|nr:hypothetical protein [Parcubacteria group bacterium]
MYDMSMQMTKERKITLAILGLIIIVLLGLLIRSRSTPSLNINNPAVVQLDNGMVKVFGKFACLSMRSGVTNPDCALGFKTAENVYYGLDTSSASSMAANLTPQDDLAITGTFAPASELDSDKFKNYAVSGVIKVKDIFKGQ